MAAVIKILVFFLLFLIKCVYPQAQPCLVCGDAVLRIWSLMSRQGDHYLRITDKKDDDDDDGDRYVVDFQGDTEHDNFTSLLKVIERSTFRETRIQFVFILDGKEYHLFTPSATGPLMAMPASEGTKVTDNRNTFAPERLLYEHRLFTVFQSIKFRGYYVSSDGSGTTFLQKVINKAYRDPSHLFLTIDPGNAIRGATFGASISFGRKKREIEEENDPKAKHYYKSPYYHPFGYGPYYRPFYPRYRKKPTKKKCNITQPMTTRRPLPVTKATTVPPTVKPFRPAKHSSISVNVDLPDKITFVVCFWIKTRSNKGQLISLVEQGKKMKSELRWKYWKKKYWKKSYYWGKYKKPVKPVDHNIFNITLYNGKLRAEIGYDRNISDITQSGVNDGKFHHVCFSLNDRYIFEVYQDSIVIFTQLMTYVACDFSTKNPPTKRRGTLTLGRHKDMTGDDFIGSLFQVNVWDQYPSFRIQRIATNCACGGGNLVRWTDLLNGTMSSVNVAMDPECPKLEGYDYSELAQNHLI